MCSKICVFLPSKNRELGPYLDAKLIFAKLISAKCYSTTLPPPLLRFFLFSTDKLLRTLLYTLKKKKKRKQDTGEYRWRRLKPEIFIRDVKLKNMANFCNTTTEYASFYFIESLQSSKVHDRETLSKDHELQPFQILQPFQSF